MKKKTINKMNIIVVVDKVPSFKISAKKTTTIGSLKSLLKEYKDDKIQMFLNNKTELNVFDTNKYDDMTLESAWKKMEKPSIVVTRSVKPVASPKSPTKSPKRAKSPKRSKSPKPAEEVRFTIDASFFKYLLATFGNYQQLIPLTLAGDTISAQVLDPSHVSIMSVYVPVNVDYKKERRVEYGIEPVKMKKFLGTNIKNKEVTFIGKTDAYSLEMDDKEETWKSLMYDDEFLGIPDTAYLAEVTLSSKTLQDIIKSKKKEMQASVWIAVQGGRLFIDNQEVEHIELTSAGNVKQMFNTKILDTLVKTANSQYASEVTLNLDEDAPMKMTYYLSMKSKYQKGKKISSGYISYHVAPQISEEELM